MSLLKGELSKRERTTLMNIVTLRVHERDVAGALEQAETLEDAEWQVQVRVYPQGKGEAVARAAVAELAMGHDFQA